MTTRAKVSKRLRTEDGRRCSAMTPGSDEEDGEMAEASTKTASTRRTTDPSKRTLYGPLIPVRSLVSLRTPSLLLRSCIHSPPARRCLASLSGTVEWLVYFVLVSSQSSQSGVIAGRCRFLQVHRPLSPSRVVAGHRRISSGPGRLTRRCLASSLGTAGWLLSSGLMLSQSSQSGVIAGRRRFPQVHRPLSPFGVVAGYRRVSSGLRSPYSSLPGVIVGHRLVRRMGLFLDGVGCLRRCLASSLDID
jgi:hypothetical protein